MERGREVTKQKRERCVFVWGLLISQIKQSKQSWFSTLFFLWMTLLPFFFCFHFIYYLNNATQIELSFFYKKNTYLEFGGDSSVNQSRYTATMLLLELIFWMTSPLQIFYIISSEWFMGSHDSLYVLTYIYYKTHYANIQRSKENTVILIRGSFQKHINCSFFSSWIRRNIQLYNIDGNLT